MMWRLIGIAAMGPAAAACVFDPPELPEPPGVIGLRPDRLIEPSEPVRVVFTDPVIGPDTRWTVTDRDEVEVPSNASAEGQAWALAPVDRWPAGQVLRVAVAGTLTDEAGHPVRWPDEGLLFEVAPRRLPMTAAIRWPTPGMSAPMGVRWLAVDGVAEARASVWLVAPDHRLAAVRRSTVAGLTWFSLEEGPCGGLCPMMLYTLSLDDAASNRDAGVAEDDVDPGIRGRIQTSSRSDDRPPVFEVAELDVGPGRIEVRWACSEPVRVTAQISGPGVEFEALVGLGRAGVWRRDVKWQAGASYGVNVSALDLVERGASGIERQLVGPAEVHVILREVVSTPRSDWGDSEPRGEPFDASPGTGTVSSADEWVELVNVSEASINVADAALRVLTLDRTPAETPVLTAPAVRFGDGGTFEAWRPGEALVVRPRGDMSQSNLVVEVWAGALLLDRLVASDGPDADHPGGGPPDLRREALARSADGRWQWCRPTPGDPRPNDQCDP